MVWISSDVSTVTVRYPVGMLVCQPVPDVLSFAWKPKQLICTHHSQTALPSAFLCVCILYNSCCYYTKFDYFVYKMLTCKLKTAMRMNRTATVTIYPVSAHVQKIKQSGGKVTQPILGRSASSSRYIVQIRSYDLFRFRITFWNFLNQFDIWQESLDGGSANRKASTSTGKHNT